MATTAQVERSLRSLMKKLDTASTSPGSIPDRSILCVLTDLEESWWAQLRGGKLTDLKRADGGERADARITATSDDLVDLIEGRLGVGTAVMSRRVRIDANPFDLILLRKLF